MPWLRSKLGTRHHPLQIRRMPAAYITESTVEQGKIWRPVNSIKENPTHGVPDMDHLCGKPCTSKHMKNWGKPAATENGNCTSIQERWYKDNKYRKSLSDIGWTEEQMKQYDAIALEDHSYVTSTAERSRNEKTLNIFLEQRGYSRTNDSKTWFYWSKTQMQKDCMTCMSKELVKETDRFLLHSKSDSDVNNNSRVSMSTITQ